MWWPREFALIMLLVRAVLGQDAPTFRTEASFISVDVQVLSHDKPVLNLSQKDFLVWDEGHPQTITQCAAENQMLEIMLVLDVSGSMVPIAAQVRETAAEAMTHLYFRDRVGVVIFNSQPYLVIGPTWDWQRVDTALSKIPWGQGGTELNATVLASAIYLQRHARTEARRAIVILTDNKGDRAVPDSTVRDGLWEADVTLSALLFGPTEGSRREADVRRFVQVTGGEVLKVRTDHLPLGEMFRRLRERYVILYRAPEGEPGSTRRIRVDLTHEAKSRIKDLKIRARTGYRVGQPGSEARQAMRPANSQPRP